MPRFADIITLLVALLSGLLLAPLVMSGLQSDRWPILILGTISCLYITAFSRDERPARSLVPFIGLIGLFILGIGLVLSVDKLVLAAGAVFLAYVVLRGQGLALWPQMMVVSCALLLVPLPAGMETWLARSLAEKEAQLLVSIAQVFVDSIHVRGAEIGVADKILSINQDCSGISLLVPALMGSFVASALTNTHLNRIGLIVSALLIAIGINTARLGALLSVAIMGDEDSLNIAHDSLGLLCMTAAWFIPMMCVALPLSGPVMSRDPVHVGTAAVALASLVISVSVLLPGANKPSDDHDHYLPVYMTGWASHPVAISTPEKRILNADTVTRRQYSALDGDTDRLVTLIYQSDKSKIYEHSSERCFTAMGWDVTLVSQPSTETNQTVSHMITSSLVGYQKVTELTTNGLGGKGGLRLQVVSHMDDNFDAQYAFAQSLMDSFKHRNPKP